MDKENLLALVGTGLDEVERLSRELGKPIDVDRSALIMLARIAVHKENGEDYMARCRNEVFYVRQGCDCKRSQSCFFRPFSALYATVLCRPRLHRGHQRCR